MFKSSNHLEKSRLGRLLVARGYITEHQLEEALTYQRQHGGLLGELLIARGLITEKELQRTLKHQNRYRYAAALVAAVVTPLQPLVALAASPAAQASNPVGIEQLQFDYGAKGGMQPLDDMEMSSVTAQGMGDELREIFSQARETGKVDGVETVKALAKTLFPVLDMLEAETSIEGVHYDGRDAELSITESGGFKVAMPSHIEQVSIKDIRVAGSVGPTFGSIYMAGIRFNDNFSLTIRPN